MMSDTKRGPRVVAITFALIMLVSTVIVAMDLPGLLEGDEDKALVHLWADEPPPWADDVDPSLEDRIRKEMEDQDLIGEEDRDKPLMVLFKELSDLEGRTSFVNIEQYYYWNYWGYRYRGLDGPWLCYDTMADGDMEGVGAMKAPTVNAPEVSGVPVDDREVEEADIVKLVDDRMYILNPYRGLLIVDLSDPDDPAILGRANVLGTPVDLYVVGDTAIVITSASMNFWNQYLYGDSWWREGEDDVAFRLGSEIALVDVGDPVRPVIVDRMAVEGYITDSRRVGDVLYFVSSGVSLSTRDGGSGKEKATYVMSVDLSDTSNPSLVDEVSFPGTSNHIHVTQELIYVAQPKGTSERNARTTDITIVDISDAGGMVQVRDTFTVDGWVEERFQLDHYLDTFRVITHRMGWNPDRTWFDNSELWTFDVSDTNDVQPLGHMVIGDAGELKATRFAGDRAYTIHLPRPSPGSYPVDPLDVTDLSDPRNPELCCVLEIPGWIDQLFVRGYQILAVGVNQTWSRQVAFSLFDVRDPYNAILQDRVVIEGDVSWSSANWDPKSMTIVDEEGLMLVPFSREEFDDRGEEFDTNGVHVVRFDLEAGDLDLAGTYSQVGAVTRTRLLEDRVISTSVKYLEVADLTDPYEPRVTAVLELCPYVIDAHPTGGFVAELVRNHHDGSTTLRVMTSEYREGERPWAKLDLGFTPKKWVWAEEHLYLMEQRYDSEVIWIELVTVDLSDPLNPVRTNTMGFTVDRPDYTTNYFQDNSIGWYSYMYWDDVYYYPRSVEQVENPVLIDGRSLAYLNGDHIYVIDLTNPGRPRMASVVRTAHNEVVDMRASGSMLLVTYRERLEVDTHDYWVNPVRYWLKRIDLTQPTRPIQYPLVNIPGVPLGTDEAGRCLYTKGSWLFDDGVVVDTLNVVTLGYERALLRWTHDLTGADSVAVEGKWAITTEWDDEGLVMELLRLDRERGISLRALKGVDGYVQTPVVDSGYIFVSGTEENGMMVYRIADGTIGDVGFFPIDRTSFTVRVHGDTAYVVQGMYGLAELDLSR